MEIGSLVTSSFQEEYPASTPKPIVVIIFQMFSGSERLQL